MNYFPTYLASGQAFCNRKDQLKSIKYKQLLNLASQFFSKLQIQVVLETVGISIAFNQGQTNLMDTLLNALEELDHYYGRTINPMNKLLKTTGGIIF